MLHVARRLRAVISTYVVTTVHVAKILVPRIITVRHKSSGDLRITILNFLIILPYVLFEFVHVPLLKKSIVFFQSSEIPNIVEVGLSPHLLALI
jgi:hypothetical protein